jgi:hypothetical protein
MSFLNDRHVGTSPARTPARTSSRRQGRVRGSKTNFEEGKRQRFLPYKSHRNYRTIKGTDAGLNIRHYKGSIAGHALFSRLSDDAILYGLLALAAIVLIALLCLLGSCVSSCVSHVAAPTTKEAAKTNPIDARVSASASENLTNKLTPKLNWAEDLEWIAAHADAYSDERLPELACLEPESASFVRAYATDGQEPYDFEDEVVQGTVPEVYDWDPHWGSVTYGNGCIATCGSGLTSLFMADAYLTGTRDNTPSALATLAKDYASDTLGTKPEFFTDKLKDLGLNIKEYTPSSDNLKIASDGDKKVALMLINENVTNPYKHWILVSGMRKDGSYVVYDPASVRATQEMWPGGALASQAQKLYAITAAKTE